MTPNEFEAMILMTMLKKGDLESFSPDSKERMIKRLNNLMEESD